MGGLVINPWVPPMDVADKALLAKARSLGSLADRMAELAANPDEDPAYLKEERRREAAQKARIDWETKQHKRQMQLADKHMRSEDILSSNARRKEVEFENRAVNNVMRQARNSIQRQLQSDPILKRAKADAVRQQRLKEGGQSVLQVSSSVPTLHSTHRSEVGRVMLAKGSSLDDDPVLRKAKRL